MKSKYDDINIADLLKLQTDKKNAEQETFNKIYLQVIHKIKYYSSASSGSSGSGSKTFCDFKVPLFVQGCPLINIPNTIEYISKKLEKKGFIIQQISYDTILISWNLSEVLNQEHDNSEKKKVEKIMSDYSLYN